MTLTWLTLPPGMTGEALLQIRDVGSAFDRRMRDARDTEEGVSWNIKANVKADLRRHATGPAGHRPDQKVKDTLSLYLPTPHFHPN